MVIAIIISVIALIISILAYRKASSVEQTTIKYKYTEKGILFYDKSGKNIVIHGESI